MKQQNTFNNTRSKITLTIQNQKLKIMVMEHVAQQKGEQTFAISRWKMCIY